MKLLFCSYGTSLVSKHFCECCLSSVGHIGYLWQLQQGQEHIFFCCCLAKFKDTIKGDVAQNHNTITLFCTPTCAVWWHDLWCYEEITGCFPFWSALWCLYSWLNANKLSFFLVLIIWSHVSSENLLTLGLLGKRSFSWLPHETKWYSNQLVQQNILTEQILEWAWNGSTYFIVCCCIKGGKDFTHTDT